MMVFIVLILTLIPSVAILYTFLKTKDDLEISDDSTFDDLARSWDYIVEGLKSAELDNALGNISDEDHALVKKKYLSEAVSIMADMDACGYERGRLSTDSISDLNKSPEISDVERDSE